MKYFFEPKILKENEDWIRTHRPLFGFDFDGTLAPIVKNPAYGTMQKKTNALFIELAKHAPVAVISGRSRRDVVNRLPRLKRLIVIGNHGMEWQPALPTALRLEPMVKEWGNLLQEALYRVPHILVEVKRFSITIHYRKEPAKKLALAAIRKHVHGARHLAGKNVINLVPHGALNKGDAFALLRRKLKLPYGVFIGDDVTDEDVFRSKPRPFILSLQVGKPDWSTAKYYLRKQSQMDRVLKMFLKIVKEKPS